MKTFKQFLEGIDIERLDRLTMSDDIKEADLDADPKIAKIDARKRQMKAKIKDNQRNDKPKQAQTTRKELGDLKNKRRDRATELRSRDKRQPEDQ